MTRGVTIILLLMLCCMSGCANYWYQEGKTFEQCRQDRDECLRELLKRTDLKTFGDYEVKFMEACMKKKGYRLVTEDELPLGVKREVPETSLHYRAKGLAGAVE